MWESPRRSSWSSSSSSSSRAGRYCETDSTLSGFSSVDEPAGEITPHSISSDSKQTDEATEDEEGGGEPEGSDSNSTNEVSSSSSNTTDLENLIQPTDEDLLLQKEMEAQTKATKAMNRFEQIHKKETAAEATAQKALEFFEQTCKERKTHQLEQDKQRRKTPESENEEKAEKAEKAKVVAEGKRKFQWIIDTHGVEVARKRFCEGFAKSFLDSVSADKKQKAEKAKKAAYATPKKGAAKSKQTRSHQTRTEPAVCTPVKKPEETDKRPDEEAPQVAKGSLHNTSCTNA